jgi:hypothetical protein
MTKTYAGYLFIAAALHMMLVTPLTAVTSPSTAAGRSATHHDSQTTNNDLRGWSYGYALSDTVGYDFPEEEEKGTLALIKEVALWVVVAGFVAFFIIKVFLQGDTEVEDSPPPGKEPPVTGVVIPLPPSGSGGPC